MNQNRLVSWLALGAGGWFLYRRLRRARRRLDLTGAAALVTGGSRGLGLAIARELGRRGAQVALMARSEPDLSSALERLDPEVPAIGITGDVTAPEDAHRAVTETLDAFGRLDILINNAGVISFGPLETAGPEVFARSMDTHFWGPLNMMTGVLPSMLERGGGRIVNIASIGGKVAFPHLAAYSASKFALVGLSDSFRAELTSRGIYVTTVCPGLMRTGSHINAEIRGDHRREYAWFAIADSLPGLTMSAERAACRIVDACRDGEPHLTLGVAARAAAASAALAPDLTAEVSRLIAWLLPEAPPGASEAKTGWESTSALAPSILTRLADRAVEPLNELRGHRAAELSGGDNE